MIKRLPPLKYRLIVLMLVNPLLAVKAGAMPVELSDACLHTVQQGQELVQYLMHLLHAENSKILVELR